MTIRQYIVLIAFVSILTGYPTVVKAATATSSPTLSATPKKSLDDLKERLATKVAELRTLVTRAIYGTVSSVSVNSAMIETTTKNYKIEYDDEVKIAQMINGKRTDLTIDDIDKADPVTVFGSYDSTLELLKAKFIFIESKKVYTRFFGTITTLDQQGFALTIQPADGKTMTADIEKTTKVSSWNATDGIVKSGFSKLTIGDSVHIIGTLDPKKDTNVIALRVLDLGNLSGEITPTATLAPSPASPNASQGGPTSTPSATPKVTPKPTLKATPKPTVTP